MFGISDGSRPREATVTPECLFRFSICLLDLPHPLQGGGVFGAGQRHLRRQRLRTGAPLWGAGGRRTGGGGWGVEGGGERRGGTKPLGVFHVGLISRLMFHPHPQVVQPILLHFVCILILLEPIYNL